MASETAQGEQVLKAVTPEAGSGPAWADRPSSWRLLLAIFAFVLLALMLGAFVALQRKSDLVAGFCVAFAAAIKAFPAIAIIYLVYRRYWKAAAAMAIASTFLLVVLPIPFRGYAAAKQDVERWSN